MCSNIVRNGFSVKFKISLLIVSVFVLRVYGEPYLFQKFPQLQAHIPHVPLCDLPTPVTRLENFGKHVDCKNICIKRDDLTGKSMGGGLHLYGGNKLRKLEFLLADSLKHDAHTIITYGCAGSNHALATAVYAHELGLKSILMLKHQPNSYVVRHNLLLDTYYDAHVKFVLNNAVRTAETQEMLQADPHAYLIPTGGSNAIGVLGFVNAVYELAHQIACGELDEPDLIYVATGSCATTAGLLLGIAAAKLKSQVVAVCIEPEEEPDKFLVDIQRLFMQANEMLHALDTSFPVMAFPAETLILNKKFCGTEYGLFTLEAVAATNLFKDLENIKLEGTYSAKPIAAIMDDAASGALQDKTVLFWNTYCGIDFSPVTNMYDYKKLPQEFQTYFEEDVQELARLK
jgi:1-aminocyclopropane-1-carboxylate deaminase